MRKKKHYIPQMSKAQDCENPHEYFSTLKFECRPPIGDTLLQSYPQDVIPVRSQAKKLKTFLHETRISSENTSCPTFGRILTTLLELCYSGVQGC